MADQSPLNQAFSRKTPRPIFSKDVRSLYFKVPLASLVKAVQCTAFKSLMSVTIRYPPPEPGGPLGGSLQQEHGELQLNTAHITCPCSLQILYMSSEAVTRLLDRTYTYLTINIRNTRRPEKQSGENGLHARINRSFCVTLR